MKLIDSSHQDLNKIAKCHRECFPGSLSSAMGTKYCQRMISWYLDTEKAFLFHVEEDNKCIGYCGGIVNDGTLSTGSASGMMQHSMKQAILAFMQRPWLILHKELRKKYNLFFKNLLTKIGIKKHSTPAGLRMNMKKNPAVGLVVIGVVPEFRGKGVSKMLLREFEERAKNLKVNTLKLSVLASNERAISAYKKNGWSEENRDEHSVNMIKIIK